MSHPCALTFANTSRVYFGDQRLRSAGVRCGLRPVPPGVPSRCGLCLQIDADDLSAALLALTADNPPDAVYEQLPASRAATRAAAVGTMVVADWTLRNALPELVPGEEKNA